MNLKMKGFQNEACGPFQKKKNGSIRRESYSSAEVLSIHSSEFKG